MAPSQTLQVSIAIASFLLPTIACVEIVFALGESLTYVMCARRTCRTCSKRIIMQDVNKVNPVMYFFGSVKWLQLCH